MPRRLHNWWTPEDFKHFELQRRSSWRSTTSTGRSRLAVKGRQTLGRHRRRGRAGRGLRRYAGRSREAGAAGAGVQGRSAVLHQLCQAGAANPRASPANQILTDDTRRGSTSLHRSEPRRLVRPSTLKPGQTLYLAPGTGCGSGEGGEAASVVRFRRHSGNPAALLERDGKVAHAHPVAIEHRSWQPPRWRAVAQLADALAPSTLALSSKPSSTTARSRE